MYIEQENEAENQEEGAEEGNHDSIKSVVGQVLIDAVGTVGSVAGKNKGDVVGRS